MHVSKTKLALISFSLFVFVPMQAQQLFYEPFNYTGSPNPPQGWNSISLYDNGGTMPGQAQWVMMPDAAAPNGLYWENRFPLFSPTSDSGAIVFNSDFQITGGDFLYNLDQECIGTSCGPHAAALESPVFNLSGQPEVGIRFFQYLRAFDSRTYLAISTDGGSSYPDTIPLNRDITDIPLGSESNPDFGEMAFNLSNIIGNQPNVRFRFVFEGEFYFWIIDDFQIVQMPQMNLEVVELVWPQRGKSCLLTDNESITFQFKNLSSIPLNNIPVFYNLNFTGQVQENFPGTLQPNEVATYTFQTPANLLPDSTNFTFLEVGVIDVDFFNNVLFEELEPCCLTHDSLGGTVIKNQLIVQFKQGLNNMQKDSVRDKYMASVIDSCRCGDLELWDVPIPNAGGGGSSTIEGLRNKVKDEPRVQDDGLNHLLDETHPVDSGSGGSYVSQNGTGDTIIMAIPDTGYDFLHDSLQDVFWENMPELENPHTADDDTNCYEFDHLGHNFIDPGTIPLDDNGHGSHIAGIVSHDLPPAWVLEILPIKTQAMNGRGTTFHNACAVYYAADKGADIINLSLGYVGTHNSILDSAIQFAGGVHDALIVCSAGNDSLDVDSLDHYPSKFSTDYGYVMSVTAVDDMDTLVESANFGLTVDIAATGKNIYSTVNGNTFDYLTGTSMAAGFVSRAAMLTMCSQPGISADSVKNYILTQAKIVNHLTDQVQMGRVLNLNDSVYTNPLSIQDSAFADLDLRIYPNPFHEQLHIRFSLAKSAHVRVEFTDALGRILYHHDERFPAGLVEHSWVMPLLPAGIYHYRILIDQQYSEGGSLIRN